MKAPAACRKVFSPQQINGHRAVTFSCFIPAMHTSTTRDTEFLQADVDAVLL
jgi:hypothetical protein